MQTFAPKRKSGYQRKPGGSKARFRAAVVTNPAAHTIGSSALDRLATHTTEIPEAGSGATGTSLFPRGFGQLPLYSKTRTRIQPKLSVYAPGDVYEQEADNIADQVTRVSEFPEPGQSSRDSRRLSIRTENARRTFPEAQSIVPSPVQDMHGAGKALSHSSRDFFEPRFGHDFGHVRIHTDRQAAGAARSIQARAFTVGRDIVFGAGQYAPNTASGRRLLAHELTHVVQQTGTHPSARPKPSQPLNQVAIATHAPATVQRKNSGKTEKEWLPELDDILPKGVGLLTHIDRVGMLVDIFGTKLLEEHVRLIHADASATKVSRGHGVPGIVALFDTRTGNRLDVSGAQKALSKWKDRYTRSSLKNLRLMAAKEAPPTFWFQDPASQKPGKGGGLTTSSERRKVVHVESALSRVERKGAHIFVRFAYPETEVSRTGESADVKKAKTAILQAIAGIAGELFALPPAANIAERREQQKDRARLDEALRSLSKSKPLNVYIATVLTPQEMLGGQVAATTNRVFVNLRDVGDPAKLDAAIRIPMTILQGGILPGKGKLTKVPAATATQLQDTMLHEALHAMLARQSSDANSIWESNKKGLTVKGSPSAQPKFVELVRKYLIAQEEVFTYAQTAILYPPVSPTKASYDVFIKHTAKFLKSKGITLTAVARSIPVSKRVAKKKVTWSINFQVPSGTTNLTVDDIALIDLLLGIYPLG